VREDQGARVVEVCTDNPVEIVQFLLARDPPFDDLGAHAADQVGTDGPPGMAGRVHVGACVDPDVGQTGPAEQLGRRRPMEGSAPS
jgi:hypothetical protein